MNIGDVVKYTYVRKTRPVGDCRNMEVNDKVVLTYDAKSRRLVWQNLGIGTVVSIVEDTIRVARPNGFESNYRATDLELA